MDISVEGLDQSIEAYRAMPNGIRNATVRSLNRAIKSGQVATARLMAADTGLKVSVVKASMAVSLATFGTPEASVRVFDFKRMPLILFNVKDSGSKLTKALGGGVSYAIGSVRKSIPNAFIAVMSNGHRGVFARVGKKRLPIRELYGPSLGKVFYKFEEAGQARADEAFRANFEHELGRMGLNASEILGESDDTADAAE